MLSLSQSNKVITVGRLFLPFLINRFKFSHHDSIDALDDQTDQKSSNFVDRSIGIDARAWLQETWQLVN